ncbi:MAG: 3'(2'),5'-bisphosphate nucleotidase CysQ [Pseudomonadota bacterium]
MIDAEHYELASALLPVVLQAGQIELGYFGSDVKIASKTDSSPVTAADQEAEEIITRTLSDVCSDIPVIGEEAVAAGQVPAVNDRFFLVDPLDGTRDFIAGGEDFTVNIALIVQSEPVFGIVYQPPTGRLFMTVANDRAIEAHVAADAKVSSLEELDARTIKTKSSADRDQAGISVAISRSHPSAALEQQLSAQGLDHRLKVGSSLKFCLVARGDADIYPRLTSISEWDTAAGHAIVTAAGGAVLTLGGKPLHYGSRENKYRIQPFVAWADPVLTTEYYFVAE